MNDLNKEKIKSSSSIKEREDSLNCDKNIEYKEGVNLYKFYYDYRMKIFNFFVTFNGILFIVVLVHMHQKIGKLIIALFAVIVTVLSLLFEIRSIKLAGTTLWYLCDLEKTLGYSLLQNLRTKTQYKGIPLRIIIRLFYFITILIWLVISVLILLGKT